MQNLKRKESALMALVINVTNCLRVIAGGTLLANRREAVGFSEILRTQVEQELKQESDCDAVAFSRLLDEQWPSHESLGEYIARTKELITCLFHYAAYLCSLNNTVRCINSVEPGQASVYVTEAKLRKAQKLLNKKQEGRRLISFYAGRNTGVHWNKPFSGELEHNSERVNKPISYEDCCLQNAKGVSAVETKSANKPQAAKV